MLHSWPCFRFGISYGSMLITIFDDSSGFAAPVQSRATGRPVAVSMYNGGGNRKWAPAWKTGGTATVAAPAAAAPAAAAEKVDCSSINVGMCLQILVDKVRAPCT